MKQPKSKIWKHKNTFAIGGLQEVGFAENQDTLLLLSSHGEGIFNCLTGEKIGRQSNGFDWWNRYNKATNTIKGFGALENNEVKVSGLTLGDILPKFTIDGWKLQTEKSKVLKIFLLDQDSKEKIFIAEDGPCELRTFGFSPTEKSFIVALSCELIIYSR